MQADLFTNLQTELCSQCDRVRAKTPHKSAAGYGYRRCTQCNRQRFQSLDFTGRNRRRPCSAVQITAAFCFLCQKGFFLCRFLATEPDRNTRHYLPCVRTYPDINPFCVTYVTFRTAYSVFLVSCFQAKQPHPDKAAVSLFKNSNSLNAGIEHAMGCSATQKACKKEMSPEGDNPFDEFFP